MSDNEKEVSPFIELVAVILAAAIVGTGIMLFLAAVFGATSWALSKFGINITWEQYIATLILLLVVRVTGSWMFHRGK